MSTGSQADADQVPVIFRVGDLLVDTGRQRVSRDDVALALPKLSYDLFLVLIRAAPNLVTNDDLLEKVWPTTVVSAETLSQRVKLLRDALGDNPRSPTYVEGLRGRGYRLIPAVERTAIVVPAAIAQPSSEQVVVQAVGTPASAADGAEAAAHPQLGKQRRAPLLLGVGVLLLIAASIGIYLYRGHAPSAKSSVDVVTVQPRAVAVLPFDNLSEAPDSQYIATGIAESVLNRLGSVRELIVIARSSSFSLPTPRPDVREIAHRLGVEYLVQGSVQRAGNRLRVNAQLVDAALNREIWSLSYDRNLDDVFAMQDEIASRVAEKLEVSLSRSRPEYAAFGTEAYLAYLRGRAQFQSRKIPELEAAIAEFNRALQLAPNFAAAMIDLAHARESLASVRGEFPEEERAELRRLVDRAIELDPAAGPAYYARAQLKLDADASHADVEADFRKGYDLAPNDALGIYDYGGLLYQDERYDEALALLERASLLNPLVPSTHYLRGQILFYSKGDLQQAGASYRQALTAAPDFYPAYTRLGLVLFFEGKLAEAIQAAEKSVAIEPHAGWTRATLIWLYLHLDDVDAARDVLRGFDAKDNIGRFNASLICYRAGNLEEADRIVRNAVKEHFVQPGFALQMASQALIDLGLARHQAAATRDFIASLPMLEKEKGRVAVTTGNWPIFLLLANLERESGNLAEANRLDQESLTWVESGKMYGPPGLDDWTRAAALAQLGRSEEALTALEHMAHLKNYWRWWVTLGSDPSFASLRNQPRFQSLAAQTREWIAEQQGLVRAMRERGEIVSRHTKAPVNGC